eukprot:scaffold111864_cov36-Phaeocystis_antarctica.AAC.1
MCDSPSGSPKKPVVPSRAAWHGTSTIARRCDVSHHPAGDGHVWLHVLVGAPDAGPRCWPQGDDVCAQPSPLGEDSPLVVRRCARQARCHCHPRGCGGLPEHAVQHHHPVRHRHGRHALLPLPHATAATPHHIDVHDGLPDEARDRAADNARTRICVS